MTDTQVVVLSAFESQELERQALDAGAYAYLDKGALARRLYRVLLGAAVRAVLAANAAAAGPSPAAASRGPGRPPRSWRRS